MKRRRIFIISLLLAFILASTGCTATSKTGSPTTSPDISSSTPSSPATTFPYTPPANNGVVSPPPPIPSSNVLRDIEGIMSQIYQAVNPSVVNIQVIQRQQSNIPQIPGFPSTGPQFIQALGSGFLWDNDGHIVTNNHVIADADNITVTFFDGTVVPGTVIGTDADSDLAVIKIDMPFTGIVPLPIADSTNLKVGQIAIAIGNPFGLDGTMTVGYISSLGRLLPANENAIGPTYSIPDIIQTDAAINPGNSGGVLLDAAGKVIGVTSSIATTTGTSAGVGFAIPSAIVQQVVPSLISTGRYDHPYLGVSLISLDPIIASAMNLPSNQRGALVETVTDGSPADKAGIKASNNPVTVNGLQIDVGGDVIIAYNGQSVKSSDDLITFLARSGSVGQTVTLTVIRGANQVQVEVTLGVRPSS